MVVNLKRISAGKTLRVLALLVLAGVLSVKFVSAQGWYNSSWQYRVPVTVTNSGSALTDFQVKISLGSSFLWAHAASDGSDIRVTGSDNSDLPFWIENWNPAGQQADIWVRVPSVTQSGQNLFVYYGNSAASSVSNGTGTFKFFDDFSSTSESPARWVRTLTLTGGVWGAPVAPHDWKYCMEMQQGSLYYAIANVQNGWGLTSLDYEIEQEFNYIHSQMNPNGTVITDSYMTNEPQYCYGVLLSNLALGYLHFGDTKPALAQRCYDDMLLLFNYLRVTWPTVGGTSDAGGYAMLLHGYSNARKAFLDFNNTTSASQALTIIQSYATTFINTQGAGGAWQGAVGVQEHMKRDFGMLKAYEVTGNFGYLTSVNNNIDFIIDNLWVPATGGLEWYVGGSSNRFFECHQQWFMTAVRLLHTLSGGTYDYLTYGLNAWHFLTDNNNALGNGGIDMYVHNYTEHGAFFAYRDVLQDGGIQAGGDLWKGSYEVGSALWGMSLNYEWVSTYQSSHSTQAYNYLDEMVKQIKKTTSASGYVQPSGYTLNNINWSTQGNPVIAIVSDAGNNVVSIRGNNNHTDLIATVDKSFDNFILEARVKMTADGNTLCNPAVNLRFTDAANRYMTQMRGTCASGCGSLNGDLFMRRYQTGVSTDLTAIPYDYNANQYYKYKIVASGNTIIPFIDGTSMGTINDNGSGILTGGIALHNYESDNAAWFDDIRVRSYAAAEPVSVVGMEQNEAPPLVITGVVSNVTCNGALNGAIDITVTGGDGTYTYLWTPGGQTIEDLTALSGGTYSVYVEDGNGPIGGMIFTVSEPAPFTAGYSVTHPPVCPTGMATVEISATGGTAPYSGAGIFSQPVGLASYTVTDANGCQEIVPVTINLAGAWLATPGWSYRKPVEITNQGGTVLTDFQVKISLDPSFAFDKINPGGSDIRFTASDGTTVLPYWIELWNDATSQATVWVRVPNIPVAGTTIYIYYGNGTAGSVANGVATFLFFDDFTSGIIDPLKWSVVGTPVRSVISYGGSNVLSITGRTSHVDLLTTVDQSFGDFVFETKVLMTQDVSANCQPSVGFRHTSLTNRYITQLRGGPTSNDIFIRKYIGGLTPNYINATAPYNYNANQFYKYKIAANGNSVSMYLDDVAVLSPVNAGGNVLTGGFSLYNYYPTAAAYFDDVRVRRYAGTEPTASFGNEEAGSTWSGCLNGTWEAPENWYGGAVPGAGSDIVIPGATNYPILYNGFSCHNLILEPSAMLTVATGGALTVSGTLTINSLNTENSGSFIIEEGATVTGTVVYNRFLRPENLSGDRQFMTSPVGGQAIPDFITANGPRIAYNGTDYRIRNYRENDGTWPIVSTGTFESGRGYIIDQATGSSGSMIFTGTAVNSATFIATSPYATGYTPRNSLEDYSTNALWSGTRSLNNYGGGGWNLMGNPFTSALDVGKFIEANSTPIIKFDPWYQALYVYDGINNVYRYATSLVPGWDEPDYKEGGLFGDIVQAGQGFFVLALYDQMVFEFNPDMQVHSPGITLLKSAEAGEPWPGLKLKAQYGTRESSTTLVYNSGMTVGLDPGYDVGQLSTSPNVEIYTSLVIKDNGVNFARQALPVADADKIYVPVGINTEKGGEVTFSAETVPLGSFKFWLEDRLSGTFTDLNLSSYTVTIPEKTYGTGRFYIVASSNTPTGIGKPRADEDELRMWAYDKKVIISGEVSPRAICEIYDMRGWKITEKRLSDGEQNIVILPPGVNGVFIVSVTDGLKVTTRKLVIL